MNLSVKHVRDKGNPDKERLVLDVEVSDELGRYLVLATTRLQGGSVSAQHHGAFWFPDGGVEAGDIVVLYTKRGSTNRRKNDDGSTSHFFYWGLDKSVWNTTRAAAAILLCSRWDATDV